MRHQVPARSNRLNQVVHRGPQQPLGSITSHGAANGASGRHAHMHGRSIIGQDCEHQQRVGVRLSGPAYPLEVLRSGQPELSLQPRPSGRPEASHLAGRGLSCFTTRIGSYQRIRFTCSLDLGASLWRPRRRRRLSTARPSAVAMRGRNPCTRTRRLILG